MIYFFHHTESPLYLLMVYAKAQREDLTPNDKRVLRQLASALKATKTTQRKDKA